MLLCLLAPQSGMISKGKQVMWRYIEENLLPMLTQAAVDEKSEEYACRLATVAEELAALKEEEQKLENSSNNPVDNTADDGRLDDLSASNDINQMIDSGTLFFTCQTSNEKR